MSDKMMLKLEDLRVLADIAISTGKSDSMVRLLLDWCEEAAKEVVRLRTHSEPYQLGDPRPHPITAEWVRVCPEGAAKIINELTERLRGKNFGDTVKDV